MSVKCSFITNLIPGIVEKENHMRKVWKSEERKVKSIGKIMTNLKVKQKIGNKVQHNYNSKDVQLGA